MAGKCYRSSNEQNLATSTSDLFCLNFESFCVFTFADDKVKKCSLTSPILSDMSNSGEYFDLWSN